MSKSRKPPGWDRGGLCISTIHPQPPVLRPSELALRAQTIHVSVQVSRDRLPELRERLKVAVEMDRAEGFHGAAAIHFAPRPDRTIEPTLVRVSPEARMDELLADGGIVERCARYNRAIGELCTLRDRLVALVQRGQLRIGADSQIGSAYRALSQLETDLEHRQHARMSSNVVSLDILVSEIAFFERCTGYIAAVTASAERMEQEQAVNTWDEADTKEIEPRPWDEADTKEIEPCPRPAVEPS